MSFPPGHAIRQLARHRRLEALGSLGAAVLLLALPWGLAYLFDRVWQNSATTFALPPLVYGVVGLSALLLVLNGLHLWQRANHADQGAKGEEDVAQTLQVLIPSGWQFEYGMRLGNRLGDADIIAVSPHHKTYVIDVKSHRGTVTCTGQRLGRRFGNQIKLFEKDFVAQAVKQARQVKQQLRVDFVTPIVAFSAAQVTVPQQRCGSIYVVAREQLPGLLQSLG
ncbi:MAG: hypothetical protein OHK0012_23900 [Synechococcales cyanobacterium]